MKILIDLLYHGTKVDARQCNVYQATCRTRPVKIDIGIIVDQQVKDAIQRAIAKLKTKKHLAENPGKK